MPGLHYAVTRDDYQPLATSTVTRAALRQTGRLATTVTALTYLRKWTGMPKTLATKLMKGPGLLFLAATGVGAAMAGQKEYQACMEY